MRLNDWIGLRVRLKVGHGATHAGIIGVVERIGKTEAGVKVLWVDFGILKREVEPVFLEII